jgi:triosephosphate isomerase
MPHRQPIIGGNWKMNTTRDSAAALAAAVADGLRDAPATAPEVVVFPPFPYLLEVGAILRDRGGRVALGAQDVYHAPGFGAFTGEVSTDMLRDCGVTHVLAGHSERRHIIGETDDLVGRKARAILAAGLTCVLCIGETLEQRRAGQTDAVNERQLRAGLDGVPDAHLARVVIAYEPVWAIGTGVTATPADAQAAHAHIRRVIASMYGDAPAAALRIQYGGSVKGSNAADLLAQPDIDGALVGGASLDAADFLRIIAAAPVQA